MKQLHNKLKISFFRMVSVYVRGARVRVPWFFSVPFFILLFFYLRISRALNIGSALISTNFGLLLLLRHVFFFWRDLLLLLLLGEHRLNLVGELGALWWGIVKVRLGGGRLH